MYNFSQDSLFQLHLHFHLIQQAFHADLQGCKLCSLRFCRFTLYGLERAAQKLCAKACVNRDKALEFFTNTGAIAFNRQHDTVQQRLNRKMPFVTAHFFAAFRANKRVCLFSLSHCITPHSVPPPSLPVLHLHFLFSLSCAPSAAAAPLPDSSAGRP